MDLKALKDLLDKVESGGAIWPSDFPKGVIGVPRAIDAYDGSIDAAVALMKKVLPEWMWHVSSSGMAIIDGPKSAFHVEYGKYAPSRALLIAILKALIYIEEAKSDE